MLEKSHMDCFDQQAVDILKQAGKLEACAYTVRKRAASLLEHTVLDSDITRELEKFVDVIEDTTNTLSTLREYVEQMAGEFIINRKGKDENP